MKYLAVVVFSLAATAVVTLTGVVMGLALFGGGDMTLLSGVQIGFAEGALRVLLASLYVALCLASLGAVGLFVSTLTEQPIGAMIACWSSARPASSSTASRRWRGSTRSC